MGIEMEGFPGTLLKYEEDVAIEKDLLTTDKNQAHRTTCSPPFPNSSWLAILVIISKFIPSSSPTAVSNQGRRLFRFNTQRR